MKDAAEQLAQFTEEYVSAYFAARPHLGARAGLHRYDGLVPDLSRQAIAARVAQLRGFRRRLGTIPADELQGQERWDREHLRLAIGLELWEWETLRHWQMNPMYYLDPLDVSGYIKRDYAPLPTRVRSLIAHLRGYPAVLNAARENLFPCLPVPFVETFLEMGAGQVGFLERDLPLALSAMDDSDLKEEFLRARGEALASLTDFIRWVKETRASQADGEFALGPVAFRQMLRWGEMVEWPLSRLWAAGEAEMRRLKEMAKETARRIHPRRDPADLMREMGREHPSAERLVPTVTAMLDGMRQFILDRRLVTIPSEVRCQVRETPPYLRWAFAMMDIPGPLEETATEAYYYITPPEDGWPPEKREEWLTAFDHYRLQAISIHEAYPGHYVHALHNRRAPSLPGKVFGAYSFWEGWAHYAEEMMLDAGYGDGDPKLRLAQIAEALLRVSRYLVAIGLHVRGMTVEEATRFFMEHAYMEELPARKEAVRGTFDPGYLNYTLGKLMLMKLRRDYEAQEGSRFSLQEFHDRFLSFGAPPLPLVRRRLLARPGTEIL